MQFGSHSQIAPPPPGEGGGVPVIWMQHIGYLRVNADIVFHANFSSNSWLIKNFPFRSDRCWNVGVDYDWNPLLLKPCYSEVEC